MGVARIASGGQRWHVVMPVPASSGLGTAGRPQLGATAVYIPKLSQGFRPGEYSLLFFLGGGGPCSGI